MAVVNPYLGIPEKYSFFEQIQLVSQHWFRLCFGSKKLLDIGHFIDSGLSILLEKYLRRYPKGNHILSTEKKNIHALAFSEDSTRLFFADDLSVITEYDLIKLESNHCWSYYTIYCLANHSKWLVSGNRGSCVTLWDVNEHRLKWAERWHNGFVMCVKFTNDGRFVVSGSRDRCIRVISVSKGESIMMFKDERAEVSAIATQGNLVLSGHHWGLINIWDLSSKEIKNGSSSSLMIQSLNHPKKAGIINEMSMNSDHTLVAVESSKLILFYEWPTMKEVRRLKGSKLRFHPMNPQLFAMIVDGRLKMYHLRLNAEVATLRGSHSFMVKFEFTPDGSRIVTWSDDYRICVWEVAQSYDDGRGGSDEEGYSIHSPITPIPFEESSSLDRIEQKSIKTTGKTELTTTKTPTMMTLFHSTSDTHDSFPDFLTS